ncbi:MAG TPA: hypothetical protein VF699_08940 [Caulobacteraceae bacterium]|jgi:hypothetical protein
MTADPIAPSVSRSSSEGRRRGGRWVWGLLIFGLVCLAAGWWLGREGSQVWGSREKATARPLARPAAAAPAAVASAPLSGPVITADALGEDGSGLAARISRLEADQARTARAAVAGLAAASLSEAAQSPAGFADALAAAERVLPASPDLAALRRLAPAGAPTRAALVASYPEAAARAAAAARAPSEEPGLLSSVSRALARLVSVRRTGEVSGSGPDALLARAEARLEAGDFDGALDQLASLPGPARDAMAGWLNRADRRAAIDRHVAAVRTRALQDLALVAGQPAPAPPA